MKINKTVIEKIEVILAESVDNVKILTLEAFKDESVLDLLECYSIFNNSTNENSEFSAKQITSKLKNIEFKKVINYLSEKLNIDLTCESELDLLFESISNNKNYEEDYTSFKNEMNYLNELNNLINENNKFKEFLTVFDGSLNNNLLVGLFKSELSESFGTLTENQNKFIDVALKGNDNEIKDLHLSNINEGLKLVESVLAENQDNPKFLKAKNKLLSLQLKSYSNKPNDKDIISVINLLDNFK